MKEGAQNMDTRNSYEKYGYVVCRNLVPVELIDKLLNLYAEKIASSKESFIRQIRNAYEPNELNEFGHVKQDFLDVHNYQNFPEFGTVVKEIVCGDAIQNTLKQITGSTSFKLMQSLLFDLNRETLPHRDSDYLDSVPGGHALAIWIALEDINEKAGKFYVIPESTNVDIHGDRADLSPWELMSKMKEYVQSNQDKIVAPALNKGDVLFWNSRLIHGALPIIDQRFSRKSLTSHFIPLEYEHGNLFSTKDYVEYEAYKGVKVYSATVPETSEWSTLKVARQST